MRRRPTNTARQTPRNTREPMSNDERRRLRAERARKRRRRRNLLIGALLTVIIVIVGVTLSLTVFFKIAAVDIAGDEIYNAEQITQASGINIGENLFLFSAKDAASAVEKALPYVEKAEIKRSLSCKVTISVTAAKAVAAIDNGEAYTLLNLSGKVLEDGVMTVNDDVVILETGEIVSAVPGEQLVLADADALADFTAVMRAFAENALTGITNLDIRDRTNIKARYKDRILLKLGEASSIAAKSDFIKATLERNEKNTPDFRGSIDFSIDKKAYQHADEQSTAAAVPTESQTASQSEPTQTAAA